MAEIVFWVEFARTYSSPAAMLAEAAGGGLRWAKRN
jgi:hypothetical protein